MCNDDIIDQGLRASELGMYATNRCFDYIPLGYTQKYPVIELHQTQCHVLTNADTTTIVFPGTNITEAEDIRLDFKKRYDPTVKEFGIFEGVNIGLNYVYTEIRDVLETAPYKNKPIKIFGHSLGGGFATELARRLTYVDCVHTFGAFKLYDSRGCAAYPHHSRHFTWVNCSDLVSRYPLRRFKEDHVGTMLYMQRNDTLIINPSESLYWFDYFTSPIVRALEHPIKRYYERIGKIKSVR